MELRNVVFYPTLGWEAGLKNWMQNEIQNLILFPWCNFDSNVYISISNKMCLRPWGRNLGIARVLDV